jgi:hypothetical protein
MESKLPQLNEQVFLNKGGRLVRFRAPSPREIEKGTKASRTAKFMRCAGRFAIPISIATEPSAKVPAALRAAESIGRALGFTASLTARLLTP